MQEAFDRVSEDLDIILKSVQEDKKKLLKLEKGLQYYRKNKWFIDN